MSSPIKVIQPSGILDGAQAGQFRQDIAEAVQGGVEMIVVDFKNVTFMDSSGLGALVLSLKTVRAAESKLFLCSINDQIKMLFELTNVEQVFEIFNNYEELEQKILGQQQ
jgi:anti-sigma B factor antagonist